jgi:hypothetical protein
MKRSVVVGLPGILGLAGMVLVAASMWAQGGLGGFRLGYVYDVQARGIRPVDGYPGAASVGKTMLANVAQAVVSPDGRFALLRENDRNRLVDLSSAAYAAHELPEFRQVVWDESGHRFALVAGSGDQIHVYDAGHSGDWISRVFTAGRTDVEILALDGARHQLWYRAAGEEDSIHCIDFQDPHNERHIANVKLEGRIRAIGLPAANAAQPLWLVAAGTKLFRLTANATGWQADVLEEATLEGGATIGIRQGPGSHIHSLVTFGDAPPLLLRHHPDGRVAERIPLDAPPEGFFPIAGTDFCFLRRSLTQNVSLEIVNTAGSQVFFVPVDPIAQTAHAAASVETAQGGLQ